MREQRHSCSQMKRYSWRSVEERHQGWAGMPGTARRRRPRPRRPRAGGRRRERGADERSGPRGRRWPTTVGRCSAGHCQVKLPPRPLVRRRAWCEFCACGGAFSDWFSDSTRLRSQKQSLTRLANPESVATPDQARVTTSSSCTSAVVQAHGLASRGAADGRESAVDAP